MRSADVVIVGAGVVGSALALELRRQGQAVLVLQRPQAGMASWAAAGMLAAHDPHNPVALRCLSELALQLYPDFLERIRSLSGMPVPIQTQTVLEPGPGPALQTLLPGASTSAGTFQARAEESLDPRQLLPALQSAAKAAGAQWVSCEGPVHLTSNTADGVEVGVAETSHTTALYTAGQVVDCTGAWSTAARAAKGQMLRVQLPLQALALRDGAANAVVRTRDIYIVPRLDGCALIGATVEDVGFDLQVHDTALTDLRANAAALIPALMHAATLDSWAGLRPRTRDDLPVVGKLDANRFIAGGLFRNGILLAPAVAQVLAQTLRGAEPDVPLAAFRPDRFA